MDKTEQLITQVLNNLDKLEQTIGIDQRDLDIIRVAINGIQIVKDRYILERLNTDPDKQIEYFRKRNTQKNETINQRNF